MSDRSSKGSRKKKQSWQVGSIPKCLVTSHDITSHLYFSCLQKHGISENPINFFSNGIFRSLRLHTSTTCYNRVRMWFQPASILWSRSIMIHRPKDVDVCYIYIYYFLLIYYVIVKDFILLKYQNTKIVIDILLRIVKIPNYQCWCLLDANSPLGIF